MYNFKKLFRIRILNFAHQRYILYQSDSQKRVFFDIRSNKHFRILIEKNKPLKVSYD